MYTEEAKQKMSFITLNYPNLLPFYHSMMGNFAFNDEELQVNLIDILNFIKEEELGYFLLCQEGTYYLTDWVQ